MVGGLDYTKTPEIKSVINQSSNPAHTEADTRSLLSLQKLTCISFLEEAGKHAPIQAWFNLVSTWDRTFRELPNGCCSSLLIKSFLNFDNLELPCCQFKWTFKNEFACSISYDSTISFTQCNGTKNRRYRFFKLPSQVRTRTRSRLGLLESHKAVKCCNVRTDKCVHEMCQLKAEITEQVRMVKTCRNPPPMN